MATQTLEFNATTGLTISCKIFELGSDTVTATQSATEKTNDKGRYTVEFSNLSGQYRLNAFVGSVGGYANERYIVENSASTFYPLSETTPAQISFKIAEDWIAAGTGFSVPEENWDLAWAAMVSSTDLSVTTDLGNMITGSGTATPTWTNANKVLTYVVTPVTSTVSSTTEQFARRSSKYGHRTTETSVVNDANGDAVDFTGITLEVCYELPGSTADIGTAVATANGNTVTWTLPSEVANYATTTTNFIYSLRDATSGLVYENGEHRLLYAAKKDA
jgi:hypothetical protein